MCFYILVLYNRYKAVFGPKLEQQPISKALEVDKKMYGDDYKCSSVKVSITAFKFKDEKL